MIVRFKRSHWTIVRSICISPFFLKIHYLDIEVPPKSCAVSGQMVLPFYNMTDRLDSPVAPSGSGGLGAAICRAPFPS